MPDRDIPITGTAAKNNFTPDSLRIVKDSTGYKIVAQFKVQAQAPQGDGSRLPIGDIKIVSSPEKALVPGVDDVAIARLDTLFTQCYSLIP